MSLCVIRCCWSLVVCGPSLVTCLLPAIIGCQSVVVGRPSLVVGHPSVIAHRLLSICRQLLLVVCGEGKMAEDRSRALDAHIMLRLGVDIIAYSIAHVR